MKLQELAQRSGVSTASIKHYLRLGLLPPGAKKNATTSVYGALHLHRLALISWIRRELGFSLATVSALTSAIDDATIPNVYLMGICQQLALGAAPRAPEASHRGTEGASGAESTILDILDRMGLPDVSTSARVELARAVTDLRKAGYVVDEAVIGLHLRALLEIARGNTTPISDDLSRDEICLEVIRGVTLHNRMLLAASALAHASLSGLARVSSAPATAG